MTPRSRPATRRAKLVGLAPQARTPRAPILDPKHATILLVDDDPAVRDSLARVLALEGWQIVIAASGEEALARLVEAQPDLMITDLRMGQVSGWDLLFHESMQRPGMPIFVITAYSPAEVGGADRFATRFFQKPLDLDALVRAIHFTFGHDAAGSEK